MTASLGAGRRAAAAQLCVLLRGADVEDQPDAQEELAQHGAQLGDQLELHHLTQVRVVGGGMCPELAKIHKHGVILHCYSKTQSVGTFMAAPITRTRPSPPWSQGTELRAARGSSTQALLWCYPLNRVRLL